MYLTKSNPTCFSKLSLPIAAVLLLTSNPALSADDESDSYIEEIIVTAEKREENILDVPLTVTGFTNRMIEELGMTRKDDLEQLVPGLQFGETHAKKGQGIVIRGMGNRESGLMQGNMAVATYVDGVYHTQMISVADGLFDVERVEVARGPQGTLNGRNSIAGSISIYSKRPTYVWDSEVMAEFTDQFSQRYGAAFGGPITEQLAFRVTGTFHDGDGAQENVGVGPDADAPESWSIKPQLRFKTESMDINLLYNKLEDTGNARIPLLLGQPPTDTPAICFSWRDPFDPRSRDPNDPLIFCPPEEEAFNNYPWYLYDKRIPTVVNCPPNTPAINCNDIENKILSNRPAKEDTFRDGLSLTADFDITENLTLRYSYGQTELDEFSSNDNDFTDRQVHESGSPVDCVEVRGEEECAELFPWGTTDGRSAFPYTNDESSHELQLQSNFDGPFNFIVGIYDYTGDTRWSDSFQGFGHNWRFTTSDERAQELGYANCEDFHAQVIAPNLEDFFGEALSEGRQIICPPSGQDDFTSRGGSASASTQKTRAMFASFDYEFNNLWAISGGLRYTEDTNIENEASDYSFFTRCPPGDDTCEELGLGVILNSFWNGLEVHERPPQAPEGCTLNCIGIKQQWDKVIWNANLEYTPRDNLLVYGRISTGYRAGGLPSPTGSFFPPLDEETVINYEGGAKGLFMENKLQLAIGGYFNDYDGFQISAIQDASGYPGAKEPTSSNPLAEFMRNVDGTTISGLDVEATYYINENWRISGYYAYLKSKLGEFSTLIQGDDNPEIGTWEHLDWQTGEQIQSTYLLPVNLKGASLPQSPKHKGAVTVTYDTALSDNLGSLQLLGTWSYTGDRYAIVQNAPSNLMPGYSRLDLRAAWTSANQQWSTTVYVQNALDEIGFAEYVPGFRPDWAFNAAEGEAQGLLTEPRQLGMQVRWKPEM